MAESTNTCAVLLVGGLGTRLRSVVGSIPKPLATIGATPFLELLVLQLRNQGIRNQVMCTGHLGEQIEDRFRSGRDWDVTIAYSREPHPLGTAGALKFAEPHLRDEEDFLVLNGDSFLEIDFRELVRFHRGHGDLVSMAVRHVDHAGRYGAVQFDASGRVVHFAEKTGNDVPGFVNAGVYVFSQRVFEHIPEGPSSLERDVFPRLPAGEIHACRQNGMFIDIGTPEDFARAQQLGDVLRGAAACVSGSASLEE
jgi:NDP-sugar pyrophosphorylase family protein